MSDIKLFRLHSGRATELQGDASDLEKPLQSLIEANLDVLLGIRLLATEYSTGKTHGGRIDTLARTVERMLVLFPFEAEIYREAGVDARFVGHPLAGGLVLGVRVVAEGGPGEVERNRHVLRLEVLDPAQHDAAEAEDGVHQVALGRGEGREGEVSAVDEPVAVEQHQAFHRRPRARVSGPVSSAARIPAGAVGAPWP